MSDYLRSTTNKSIEPRILQIYQYWINSPSLSDNISRRLKLTKSEQQWLQQHPEIRQGIDHSWPPIEFVDDQGHYQGLAAEFFKVMTKNNSTAGLWIAAAVCLAVFLTLFSFRLGRISIYWL